MGNRAYFTLKTPGESKTYYTHWNGGLDTFAPLCKALFDRDIKHIDSVLGFFKHLDIKTELQDAPDAQEWNEENGHYFIDLSKQTLDQRFESGQRVWHSHLKDAFEGYLAKYIKEDYRDKVRADYWDGIMDAANKFFGPLSKPKQMTSVEKAQILEHLYKAEAAFDSHFECLEATDQSGFAQERALEIRNDFRELIEKLTNKGGVK